MPGKNPQQAVTAFLAPFCEALRVLEGVGKLSVSPKGGYRLGQRYSWQLNGAEGMNLGAAGVFIASMEFEVVDADPTKNEYRHPYRVTTRSYHYKLRGRDGKDQWRIHWHPDGRSRVRVPHIHRPPDLKQHWPTGRMTFENALAWCIESGAAVRGGDAEHARNQLAVIEAPHLLYRSWT